MKTRARLPQAPPDTRRILAISDIVEPQLYNARVAEWMGPVDMIISCGDLPVTYLEFLMSTLNAPCYHVIGNHCFAPHGPSRSDRCSPDAYPGITDLHMRTVDADGLLLAGIEGSPWYNGGPHQYSEQQVAWGLRRLVPRLLINYLRTGRYLDILVTHAPPRGIHDDTDVTHRGFSSFLWFIHTFRPAYLLHGHTHRYINTLPFRTRFDHTTIVNTYGHRILDLPRDPVRLHSGEDVDGR